MVLGASFDPPEENKAFAEAEGFPYQLLSDVDHTVGEAYGVLRDAGADFSDWARRITFLIDPEGTVRKIYVVRDTAAHPGEILADLHVLLDQQGGG